VNDKGEAMKLKWLIIAIIFLVTSQYVCAEDGKGVIKGRALMSSGKPMQYGLVLCYLKQNGPAPLPERYWRVPDAVIPVESTGKFSVELIEGQYYVGVIGRKSSKLVPGPPIEGDSLILLKDKKGKPEIITVTAGKTIDTGTRKGSIYKKSVKKNNKITAIEGVIKHADGTPVSGAFVFAFHSPERASKPVFASEKTDNTGKYFLRVEDGTFYLKVRDVYGGGRPQTGEIKGVYGGDEPVPVSVKVGSILKDIDIGVQQIQRPEGN
jgi:hypothetical protein